MAGEGIIKIHPKINLSLIVSLLLIIVTLLVYGQVRTFNFSSFDDDLYVTDNRYVQSGLGRGSIRWSFSFNDKNQTYWHPLTWISHMMDVSLYGLESDGHHLTNVLFHIANSILLFIALRRMTGALWRSALVAVLFAIHPINVESVAWVAERKNVLSTFFWMLTVLSYIYFARRPNIYRYLLICVTFILGLLAKPMLVTLPFVLLLLDFWPLQRFSFIPADNDNCKPSSTGTNLIFCKDAAHRIVMEKIPLFILSGISIYLSSASVKGAGNVITTYLIPIHLRVSNAVVSYIKYGFKLIWPLDMAVFYPYPETIALWQTAACLSLLVSISAGVVMARKRYPYLGVGWLWYLGTLVPVSGLVQAGLWPAMADRWAYVPFIGLFIMISWGIGELAKRWPNKKRVLVPGAFAVLIVFTAVAWNQTRYWANGMTLFAHAVKVAPNSWITQFHLGSALSNSGHDAEAIHHYQIALNLNSKSARTHHNFGNSLLAIGKDDSAINHFSEALKLNSNFSLAYNSLGLALLRTGRIETAIISFKQAVKLEPNYKNAQKNLNLALSVNRRIDMTAWEMKQALAFSVKDPGLSAKMQTLLIRKKALEQVLQQYQKALSRQPGFSKLNPDNIASVSRVKEDYEMSLKRFKAITEELPGNGDAFYHIACIYSRWGNTTESIKWIERAVKTGFANEDMFKIDSDLKNIRQTAIYQDIAKIQQF